MSLNVISPLPVQRWDCRACGRCCRGIYSVPVTNTEREDILQQGWEQEGDLRGKGLFITHGQNLFLARDETGACVFLDGDGRCRIHAKFGENAKPLACRMYPFVLTPTGRQVHIGLRFDCPSVQENHGRPLVAHLPGLRPMVPEVLPDYVETLPVPEFDKGQKLPLQHLVRVVSVFDDLLCNGSLSITRRMLGCGVMAHLLHASKVDQLNHRLDEFIEAATKVVLKAIERDSLERVPPRKGTALLFRQAVGLYNRWDRMENIGGPVFQRLQQARSRLVQVRQLMRGRGIIPALQPEFPQVPFSTVEESFGEVGGTCDELLTRYYRMKLAGMDFFGPSFHNYSFIDGLLALLLTYPAILWSSRVYAIGSGMEEVDVDSLRSALGGVDAQHGRSPAFGLHNERVRIRILCQENNLRSLTIWYGT